MIDFKTAPLTNSSQPTKTSQTIVKIKKFLSDLCSNTERSFAFNDTKSDDDRPQF